MPFQTMTLDRFFAETILKKAGVHSEEQILALSRLMRGALDGNLCMDDDLSSLPSTIVEEGKDLFPRTPIVRYKGRCYIQKNWVYETCILQHTRRLRTNRPPDYFDRKIFEENLSRFSGLLPSQADAIRSCLDHSLLILCGGPGTGKTYTAGHLARLLFSSLKRGEKSHFHVCAAAPTGKAASHLQSALLRGLNADSSLQIEAATLHRLLKLQPDSNRLFSNRKIDADLIIVDEASMIDVSLLAHLLEAVGDDTVLVLIGDPDQLPPVEAGSLFSEMGALFGVHLEQCMRTDERNLQELAEAVKMGNSAEFFRLLELGSLWSEEALSAEKLYARIDPTGSGPKDAMKKYGRFRILNAIRQGAHGADALNREIFQLLQSRRKSWAAPILATVNDSFSELYNGMSGLLIGERAYFPDTFYEEIPPYELAFCLSIHKSQGSEFEEVLALFPEGSENFGREALYTAVTRAKSKLQIVGRREILEKMIASTSRRMSGFSTRVRSD